MTEDQWNSGRVNVENLSEEIVDAIHQQSGEPVNTMERLKKMSPKEIFKRFLNWNGIMGYEHQLIDVVENIQSSIKPKDKREEFEKWIAKCVVLWTDLTPDDYWKDIQHPGEAIENFANYLIEECKE